MIPENKKIAVLHPQVVEVWGAVKMMFHLYKQISKQNKVVFFTTNLNSKWFKEIPKIIEVKTKIKFISYLILAYKIKDFDYVIAWNSPMHFVGVLSKIFFQAKFKLFWWNHHYPWYHNKKHSNLFISLKRFLERKSIKYIDLFIANSQYIKDSLIDIFNLQSRQIKILYPVVSQIFEKNDCRQSRQNKKITLFTYSRWDKWKNLWVIFKMYDTLSTKYDFNILIWWEGIELEKYKNKYSSCKRISFMWRLCEEDILKYSSESHIFLFPSLIDSFWISILEMMFCSLPIIWFNSWWVSELIKNWKNGFLCNSDLDFIQKTEKLILDKELREKMSIESYNIAISKFKSNNFILSLKEIFKN